MTYGQTGSSEQYVPVAGATALQHSGADSGHGMQLCGQVVPTQELLPEAQPLKHWPLQHLLFFAIQSSQNCPQALSSLPLARHRI
jgi:hypothetical protein